MNERIKELLIQSEAFNKDCTVLKGITGYELNKFAQLIVRECLEACSRANDIKHFVPPTQEQVVLSCMREIETTFRS